MRQPGTGGTRAPELAQRFTRWCSSNGKNGNYYYGVYIGVILEAILG